MSVTVWCAYHLRHKDDNKVFLGVDPEFGIGDAAPGIFTSGGDHLRLCGISDHAGTEPDGLPRIQMRGRVLGCTVVSDIGVTMLAICSAKSMLCPGAGLNEGSVFGPVEGAL